MHAAGDQPKDGQEFSDTAWVDVIRAVDRTYSELVAYQEELQDKNQQLEDMRQFMTSVLRSVSDVLIVVDRAHLIEQTGGSFADLLDDGHGDGSGLRIDTLATEATRPALTAALDRVLAQRDIVTLEIEIATRTGPAPLDLRIAPRLNDRGRSVGAVIVGRPVGELRRAYRELETSHRALQQAQAHLVRNEKLASLGRLVAGVAHELNNPISFVYANTHALEKYTARLETYFDAVQAGSSRAELIALRERLGLDRAVRNLRSAVGGARDGAERVRDIVADLRRLSSSGSGEVADFDLGETARTAANWVVRGTATPVRVLHEGDAGVTARGDPGHIQQIVMNLVQNAIDALAGTDAPQVTLRVQAVRGRAQLRVIDNGPGIEAGHAASIFDPFFTTKPVGKGTGLGLSISHRIAQEHGGDLSLCDPSEGGTCFCLDLPAAPGGPGAGAASEPASGPASGPEAGATS